MLPQLPKLRWFVIGSGLIALLVLGAERVGRLLGQAVQLFDHLLQREEKELYIVHEGPDGIGYYRERVSTVFDGYDTVEDLFGDTDD